jgi:small-conductance mechanosensitive channel
MFESALAPLRAHRFLGLDGAEWLVFFAVWASTTLALYLLNRLLVRRTAAWFRRTRTVLDDYLADLLVGTRWFFLAAVGLYAATRVVEPGPRVAGAVASLAFLLLLVQAVLWFNRLIARYIRTYNAARLADSPGAVTTMQAVGFVSRLLVYTVALLLALDNLGVDITALVASLGIGGIAVALALQNVLSDLFASLSIVLDKPFVVGDFLIVGEHLGTVEKVGLKTTRLRSLSGEQLVFSNTDLLGSRIRNYQRMQERRVVFGFGVTYQTGPDVLEALPALVRAIVERQEGVRFDRAHFKAFGASSLDFEVVYYVLSADYAVYMDVQQQINLALFREVQAAGAGFAYPTQTLHVARPETALPVEVRRGDGHRGDGPTLG